MKNNLIYFSGENKAEPDVSVGTSCVPIEVELTCENSIVVIAASIEPRISRVNKVRIVAVRSKKSQRSQF